MVLVLKGVFHPMCLLVAVLSSHPYGPPAVVRFACYLGDGSMYFSYHTFYFLHKKNLHTWISFDVHHPISPTITARLVLYHQIDAEAIPDLRKWNKIRLKNKFQLNLYESYHLKNQVYWKTSVKCMTSWYGEKGKKKTSQHFSPLPDFVWNKNKNTLC